VFAWIVCAVAAATLMLVATGGAFAADSKKPSGGKIVAGGKVGKSFRRQDTDPPGDDPLGQAATEQNTHFGW
jgi:hypothetical protein